jgi:hypothetical protein
MIQEKNETIKLVALSLFFKFSIWSLPKDAAQKCRSEAKSKRAQNEMLVRNQDPRTQRL